MMSIINEIMSFKIPDKMREMNQEEYGKFFRSSGEENYGLYNEEKHTVISVAYKKRPLLLGRSASAEETLKTTEKKLSKQIPAFEITEYKNETVDGESKGSFYFQYTVQGVKQTGEYVLCCFPKYNCSFEYICREDHKDFAEQKFHEFISSVKFTK